MPPICNLGNSAEEKQFSEMEKEFLAKNSAKRYLKN